MGSATATIEMRTPEETRERLHEMVKATDHVVVLSSTAGAGIDGQSLALVHTNDDTTMFLSTLLDAGQIRALERNPRIALLLHGADDVLFTGEVVVSRERALIDELWTSAWQRWARGKADPRLAIMIMSPIEGSYWEGNERQSYLYRLVD
jgi:general stress protein 26